MPKEEIADDSELEDLLDEEEEIEEDELEEILDEEAFKEIAAEIRAISKAEELTERDFDDFIQLPIESDAPILDQVAIAQQTSPLEVEAMQGSFQKEENKGEIKYSGSNGYGLKKNGGNGYESNKGDGGYESPYELSSIDISSAGRESTSQFGEVTFSNQEIDQARSSQKTFEEYTPSKLEKFDETRTAHSPTEQGRDKKYEPRNL